MELPPYSGKKMFTVHVLNDFRQKNNDYVYYTKTKQIYIIYCQNIFVYAI